jgi:hypothetical protein
MGVTLALSTLCENPGRRTGLSTFFPEFVGAARRIYPDVAWLVFAGRDTPWSDDDPGVAVCRDFSSNEHPLRRLAADHLRVAPEARRRGAAALVTVGFMPLRSAGLPVAMQVFAFGDRAATDPIRRAYRNWALSRGLRDASLVIANSAWTRSRLGPAGAAALVSPEGLQHARFRPDGPRGLAGLPPRYLLWASNFYPYKRADRALAAYATLSEERRAQFPLVLAGGEWGEGRSRAQAKARSLGIERDVRFLGWVEDADLPALCRGAQAYVLSTALESFGRGALETMACGCPGVLQDLPVLREVAGEAALYVDYDDVPAAGASLEAICSDGALRSRLAEAGLARAGTFSFERLARERVGALLERLGRGAS